MRVIEIPGLFHSPISTSPSPSFLPVVKLSGGGGGEKKRREKVSSHLRNFNFVIEKVDAK